MEVTPIYELRYSEKAFEDIAYFKKLGDTAIIRKINRLLDELEQHPAIGTGQVEALKHNLAGYWCRRINQEHRLLYSINNESGIVYIYSLKGHY